MHSEVSTALRGGSSLDVVCLPPDTPPSLSMRIKACMLSCKQTMLSSYRRIMRPFRARPIYLVEEPKSKEVAISHTPHPAISDLAAERLARQAAVAAARDLKMRTDSLLNSAAHQAPSEKTADETEKNLSDALKWRSVSLTEYGPKLGFDPEPDKQLALEQWQTSYATLRDGYLQDDEAHLTHATSCYEALKNLSQCQAGTIVRYGGAFGKKQFLLQTLLSTFKVTDQVATRLPAFLENALKADALASPETLISYGFDLLLSALFEQNPNPQLSREAQCTLDFLKPVFPDMDRHSQKWDSIKTKLPTWLAKQGDAKIRQGLLCFFLECIPDNMQHEYIDLLEELAKDGKTYEKNHRALLLKWKPFLMKKALEALPLASLENMHAGLEERLSTFLQSTLSNVGLPNPLTDLLHRNLFSYGNYWLEWTFDHPTKTYALSIYASGSSLTDPDYPRQDGKPIWPIRISGLAFDFSSEQPLLLKLLKAMSETTGAVERWNKNPRKDFHPLTANDLFGEHGLVTQLKKMSARLSKEGEVSVLPDGVTCFTQKDMVSHYCHPEVSPSRLRYNILRQRLLQACAHYAHVTVAGEPPHLVLPEGEAGERLLLLFQSAIQTLRESAKNEGVDAQTLREYAAFEEQLEVASKARKARTVHTHHLSDQPEARLGQLIDMFLQALCPTEERVHTLMQYRELIVFALGKGSEKFVDLLCIRAKQLQEENPSVTPTPSQAQAASAAAPAQALPSHPPHSHGSIGSTLYTMYVLLKVIRFVRKIERVCSYGKRVLTYGWIALLPDALRLIAPRIIPQSIQETLSTQYHKLLNLVIDHVRAYVFKFLFPRLQNLAALRALHESIIPYLAGLPGVERVPDLTVTPPQPVPVGLPLHPVDRLSHTVQVTPVSQQLTPASDPVPFQLGSHAFYQAQKRCEQALTSRLQQKNGVPTLSINDLTAVLTDWEEACKAQPLLMIHQIHQLPLFDSQGFTLCLDSDHARDDITCAIDKVMCLGKLLEMHLANHRTLGDFASLFPIFSHRDYQLAQYRLLGFADRLARHIPDHPFNDAPIDADPLLKEWSNHASGFRGRNIYPESSDDASTVLRYFYPTIPTLDALIHSPPSSLQRKEWSRKRWFYTNEYPEGWDTAYLHSPEYIYYQNVARRTQDQPLSILAEGTQCTYIPLAKPKKESEQIRRLFQIAHDPKSFENPLDELVPLLRAQMLRCCFYRIRKDNVRKAVERTCLNYPIIEQYHASANEYVKYNLPDEYTDSEAFWAQDISTITKQGGAEADEPLTAPAKALRLIARDPQHAVEEVFILRRLFLRMGHLEVDFQENLELIDDCARALSALFDATQETSQMREVFDLALAVRHRAWKADPNTKAFAFLQQAISRLRRNVFSPDDQWMFTVYEALYHDHPQPECLSSQEQAYALTLLFTALHQYQEGQNGILHKRLIALQQMALHWYPCMQLHENLNMILLKESIRCDTYSPQQKLAYYWPCVARSYGIDEMIPQGTPPSSTMWMEINPSINHSRKDITFSKTDELFPAQQIVHKETVDLYTQQARICRMIGDKRYILLPSKNVPEQLLQTLSHVFPWIDALKPQDDAQKPKTALQYWIHEYTQEEEGVEAEKSKAILLVTDQQQQWSFALESHNDVYELLGMLEKNGTEIVYPASESQVATWCAGLQHFCPLSSIALILRRAPKSERPLRCRMSPFNLEFALVKAPCKKGEKEEWRWESIERYPGFWVSKQQTVPFGLILENEAGEKQLLLPENTLAVQALYAQVDPLLGVLGHLVQRQSFLHSGGALHSYKLVSTPYLKDRWVSQSASAMVHLLLLYFASRKKQELHQVGNALLQMPLPESLEMELLPLALSKDPHVQTLYANLLAHIENSRLAHIPDTAHARPIGQYLRYIPMLALINSYQLLATEKGLTLSDSTCHTLFARYRRLLHANRDQLIASFKYSRVVTALSTDLLALQLLPQAMKARVESLEFGIGNKPGLLAHTLTALCRWQQAPTPAFFEHPLVKPLIVNQGFFARTWTTLQALTPPHLKDRVLRFWTRPQQQVLPDQAALCSLSSRIQQELDPVLEPESVSKETLIPYFLTYQAMAQGDLGTPKQTRLIQHLYVLQWTLSQGLEKQLSTLLLTIALHPKQYYLFNCIRNRNRSLRKLLIEHRKGARPSPTPISNGLHVDPAALVPQQQQEALLHQWRLLARFHAHQPVIQTIQTLGTSTISMIGAYYMLSMVSTTVMHHTTALIITPSRNYDIASPEHANTIIPLSLVCMVFMTAMHRSALPKKVASMAMEKSSTALQAILPTQQRCASLLKPFNRFTGFHVTTLSLLKLANMAFVILSMQCLLYTTTILQPAPFTNSTSVISYNAENRSTLDPLTAVAYMIVLLPTFKYLFKMAQFLYIAQGMYLNPVRKTYKVLQPPPGIPLTCQRDLEQEDARFRGILDPLFDEHFVAHTIEISPVEMPGLNTSTIQRSLIHYARRPEARSRTLFSLRSLETLHTLESAVKTLRTQLEQSQKQELNALFQALGIEEGEQEIAMEALRRFFAVGDTHALKAYNLTEEDLARLATILPPFFLRETERQQLQRIAKAIQKLQELDSHTQKPEWDTACEQLITHMRARRMYPISDLSPERLALFLAFESATETLLWKPQVEAVSQVLDARGKSVAYELLMSLGKTFFAIPMTALSEADGSRVVFLVWPDAMYREQTQQTGEQLFLMSGRTVTPLSIDRSMPITVERLDALLRLIKNTRRDKGVISTRQRDLKSLELLFVSFLEKLPKKGRLSAEQVKIIAKMQRLLATLRKRATFIVDESHKFFEDVVLHFPLGPKEKIDLHEADATRCVTAMFLQGPLGHILRTCTRLDAREDSTELLEEEQRRIADQVIQLWGFDTTSAQRAELVHYLLDKSTPTPTWLENDPTRLTQRKKMDAARGVLLDLFPLFHKRAIGGAFGPSLKTPDLPFVIPYDGNDNPAENKRIATPHEALTKTLVYYWHHKIPVQRLKNFVMACEERSKDWARKQNKPASESPEACAFAALFSSRQTLSSATEKLHNAQALEELFEPIQCSIELILLYSQCYVEPSLEYQSEQCSSSAHNCASMARSNVACTGTPYNEAIYPLEMQRQLNSSTLGEAITHIKNKCPPGGVGVLTKDRPEEVLDEVIEKYFLSDIHATALMDGGGLLTGLPHKEVARILLEKRPDIEVVDYFEVDPITGESTCMSLIAGAKRAVPMHTCKIPLEKRIAYFDQSHCFAANIPQPQGGKGVWLVGMGHQLFNGVQDAFRMRGLKKYIECLGLLQDPEAINNAIADIHKKDLTTTQTLYVALAPQVGRLLQADAHTPPTLEQVVAYLADQTAKLMKTVHFQGGLSMLEDVLRNHIIGALLSASNASEVLQHFHQSRDRLITSTAHNATALFGGARGKASGAQVIQARYQEACTTIRHNPLLSDEQQAAALAKLDEVRDHLLTLSLPEAIPVHINVQGACAVDGIENVVGIEAEAAQDKEKERERERERESEQIHLQTEGTTATPFSLQPWSKTCPLDSSQWNWIDSLQEGGILSCSKRLIHSLWNKVRHRQGNTYSPPLFSLKAILEKALEPTLNQLSESIDPRIWWSNHLLPQIHLHLTVTPAAPATSGQRKITHLLIEVEPEKGGNPARILSVGCLGVSDANYWIERLQAEHNRARYMRPGAQQAQRLFMVYQMPTLEKLDENQPYDGTVIARNKDSTWKPQDSKDFERLETMIKLCNGDHCYTQAQCTLLRKWKREQHAVGYSNVLNRAFTLFYTMAQQRLKLKNTRSRSLDEIIDPL